MSSSESCSASCCWLICLISSCSSPYPALAPPPPALPPKGGWASNPLNRSALSDPDCARAGVGCGLLCAPPPPWPPPLCGAAHPLGAPPAPPPPPLGAPLGFEPEESIDAASSLSSDWRPGRRWLYKGRKRRFKLIRDNWNVIKLFSLIQNYAYSF